jgi:hypothetical protein
MKQQQQQQPQQEQEQRVIKTQQGTFIVMYSPGRTEIQIRGQLENNPDEQKIAFLAAAPVEFRTSIMGSGLPYATKEQAFHNTPNQGVVPVSKKQFVITMETPGSYYVGLGTVLIPPVVFLTYLIKGDSIIVQLPVDDPFAFRFNTYPMQFTAPRSSPLFYSICPEQPARSQEEILRASAYPSDNQMPPNFWGTKPPL